jgi:hypothetical protein
VNPSGLLLVAAYRPLLWVVRLHTRQDTGGWAEWERVHRVVVQGTRWRAKQCGCVGSCWVVWPKGGGVTPATRAAGGRPCFCMRGRGVLSWWRHWLSLGECFCVGQQAQAVGFTWDTPGRSPLVVPLHRPVIDKPSHHSYEWRRAGVGCLRTGCQRAPFEPVEHLKKLTDSNKNDNKTLDYLYNESLGVHGVGNGSCGPFGHSKRARVVGVHMSSDTLLEVHNNNITPSHYLYNTI